jgi:hypothetical protein
MVKRRWLAAPPVPKLSAQTVESWRQRADGGARAVLLVEERGTVENKAGEDGHRSTTIIFVKIKYKVITSLLQTFDMYQGRD